MLSPHLLDILSCPHCRGELRPDEGHALLVCARCERRYRVEQDIPIMIDPDEPERS